MRIIAGEWRGRTISAPKGDGTRPTTDRVRESLMSSLNSWLGGFEDQVVLDAFSGSGALGLEAVSRGAAFAQLCEQDANAAKTIQKNIQDVRATRQQVALRRGDVLNSPPHAPMRPYSLIFLDPPYALDPAKVFAMLDALGESGSLTDDCFVTYEHDKKDSLAPFAEAASVDWEILTTKTYGKTTIDLIRRNV